MSKKDGAFTRIFNLTNILEMITSTALATQSLLNPAGAIVLTPIIKALVMIAVDFCKQKESDCIDEAKGLIEGYLTDEPQLSDSELYMYTKLTFECLKEFDANSFSGVTLNKVKDKISGEVKKKYPNTNDDTYMIFVNAIAYTVAEICYNLNGSEKDFKDYCIKNTIFTIDEIDRLKRKYVNLDERVIKLEKKVEDNISKKIKQCANYFTDALYLHKDTTAFKEAVPEKVVNLKNLFIKQKVVPLKIIDGYKEMNIEEHLSSYAPEDHKVTLLLGDAGVGKSSIVYWLADLYLKGENEEKRRIFNDKELVVVRLRDLSEDVDDDLFGPTCNYFECNDDDVRNDIYSDKFVVLDGLDEIRSKNHEVKFEKILKNTLRSFDNAYRLIITSRPGVESVAFKDGEIKKDFKYLSIYSIKPFGKREKDEWIAKYESVAGKIDTKIIKYINPHILPVFVDKIFDYPQILYMVASASTKDESWSLNNEWSLYHHIFYDQIMSKEYERYNRGRNSEHPLKDNIDAIYYGLEKIAYEMYLNNYKSRISFVDLNGIFEKDTTSGVKELLNKFAFRFGCYGKIDNNISEFEFYHNNIRDFFIAEYIYDRLNDLFSEIVEPEVFADYINDGIKGRNQYLKFEKGIYNILRCIPIQKKVVDFMISRTMFRNTDIVCRDKFYIFLKNNVFSYKNGENTPIQNLCQELFCNLQIYNEIDAKKEISAAKKVSRFLNNFISIVHAIYSCYDNKAYIQTFNYIVLNNLSEIYSRSFDYLNEYVCLNKACLVEARLEYASLNKAYLVGANLTKVNLSNASLIGVELSGANMFYAKLMEADLRNACLREANLKNAKLMAANLVKADLSEAHLEGADLRGANLNGAFLCGTHLEYADLRGASLCDGNLIGAHLKEADLENANLIGTVYDMAQIKQAKNWEKAKF